MAMRKTPDLFDIAAGWRERAAAFAREILFSVLFLVASYGANTALVPIQHQVITLSVHLFLSMAGNYAAAIVLIVIMARFSGRRFAAYGYTGPHKLRNFLVGLLCAVGLLAIQLLTESELGYFSFGHMEGDVASLAWFGGFYAALFLLVGFTEESLFRG